MTRLAADASGFSDEGEGLRQRDVLQESIAFSLAGSITLLASALPTEVASLKILALLLLTCAEQSKGALHIKIQRRSFGITIGAHGLEFLKLLHPILRYSGNGIAYNCRYQHMEEFQKPCNI